MVSHPKKPKLKTHEPVMSDIIYPHAKEMPKPQEDFTILKPFDKVPKPAYVQKETEPAQ